MKTIKLGEYLVETAEDVSTSIYFKKKNENNNILNSNKELTIGEMKNAIVKHKERRKRNLRANRTFLVIFVVGIIFLISNCAIGLLMIVMSILSTQFYDTLISIPLREDEEIKTLHSKKEKEYDSKN